MYKVYVRPNYEEEQDRDDLDKEFVEVKEAERYFYELCDLFNIDKSEVLEDGLDLFTNEIDYRYSVRMRHIKEF